MSIRRHFVGKGLVWTLFAASVGVALALSLRPMVAQFEIQFRPVVTSFEMHAQTTDTTSTRVRILMYKDRDECHFRGLAFYWTDPRGIQNGASWSPAEPESEHRQRSRPEGWHEFSLNVQTSAALDRWSAYVSHDCGTGAEVITKLWPWQGDVLSPDQNDDG